MSILSYLIYFAESYPAPQRWALPVSYPKERLDKPDRLSFRSRSLPARSSFRAPFRSHARNRK